MSSAITTLKTKLQRLKTERTIWAKDSKFPNTLRKVEAEIAEHEKWIKIITIYEKKHGTNTRAGNKQHGVRT